MLSDHDLRQIDEIYLRSLGSEELIIITIRLLNDLKEARDRLNQNPSNSSRPPSSREPWIVAKLEEQDKEDEIESDKVDDDGVSLSEDEDEDDDKEEKEKKR